MANGKPGIGWLFIGISILVFLSLPENDLSQKFGNILKLIFEERVNLLRVMMVLMKSRTKIK